MKTFLDEILPIITIAAMFAGLIWRLASIKSALESSIDSATDLLNAKINILELEIRIASTQASARNDFLDYRLHGHDEQIKHKFDRCWSEIKDLQKFSSKNGFIARSSNEKD